MIQESQLFQKVVWVIDDDETALLLADEVLTGAGFQVRTFSDAATALADASAGLPDLVVVDVIMPGLDGFEFCSRLRQLPQAAVIPILVTTSLDDTASINRACQAGATNFVTKPINWATEVQSPALPLEIGRPRPRVAAEGAGNAAGQGGLGADFQLHQ